MLMPIHLLFAVFDVNYQGLNWHSLFCTKLLSLVLSMYLFCAGEVLIRSVGSITVKRGPKSNFFLRHSTICVRTQTHAYHYSGNPVDQMSAVWKCFKLDSESSPMATCNFCSTTISWGGNKKAEKSYTFDTIKYYREGNWIHCSG